MRPGRPCKTDVRSRSFNDVPEIDDTHGLVAAYPGIVHRIQQNVTLSTCLNNGRFWNALLSRGGMENRIKDCQLDLFADRMGDVPGSVEKLK